MLRAFNEPLQEFFRTGSGKAGAILLLILVSIAIYAAVAYPPDFGPKIWNDRTKWTDNPEEVPPIWAGFLSGRPFFPHQIYESTKPSFSSTTTNTFSFTFKVDSDSLPTFMSLTVRNVTFYEKPAFVSLSVKRPDGHELTLYNHVFEGLREGETLPVSRNAIEPLRVLLSSDESAAQAVADFYFSQYGKNRSSLPSQFQAALLGRPSEGRDRGFEVLHGDYRVDVRFLFQDQRGSVQDVIFILGGTYFGAMGTDDWGRDLVVGLAAGFPVALIIGIVTSLMATIVGTGLGVISGYVGGKTDTAIQRASDIMANIPLLPILIFLTFLLGQKLWIVIVILIIFGWPGLTIVVRSMVLQIKSGQFVEAALAMGASKWRIMFKHIFVHTAPFVFAQMIFSTPAAILAEAALSFLGLGDPSIPTWGQILQRGFSTGLVFFKLQWWWILPPGLLIVLAAFTFVLIALGLEPVVNPRVRRVA